MTEGWEGDVRTIDWGGYVYAMVVDQGRGNGGGPEIPPPSTLLDGLQVYYKLEDVSDSTSNGLTLTNNNSVTFVPGKIANAAHFVSSSGQYLSHADASQFQMGLSSDFTVSFWLKTTAASLQGWVMYGDLNSGFGYGINMTGGAQAQAFAQDGIHFSHVVGGVPGDNNWHFMVMTASRTGNLTFYIDNSSIGTSSMTSVGSVNSSSGFAIGSNATGNFNADALIDEVGIWNRVLTGSELTDLYGPLGDGNTYPFS